MQAQEDGATDGGHERGVQPGAEEVTTSPAIISRAIKGLVGFNQAEYSSGDVLAPYLISGMTSVVVPMINGLPLVNNGHISEIK